MTTHLVIPDSQVRPGVSFQYLDWIGRYIVDNKPDKIIHLGDFADMHSLSTYSSSLEREGRRYADDIAVAKEAWDVLNKPILDYNAKKRKHKEKQYNPKRHICLGNHENRITRTVELNPGFKGTIGLDDLKYNRYGWKVHDFLKPVEIDGILYCHYFPRSPSGRVMQSKRGAPNARVQVQREGQSCTAGHMQSLDAYILPFAKNMQRGMIAGSCYMHDEGYLTPQGNGHWHGIIHKTNVKDGWYDYKEVSLPELCRRYEGVEIHDLQKAA